MAASVLPLCERLTLKELGAICKVLSVSRSWPLLDARHVRGCAFVTYWAEAFAN